jgi:TP53 regulating kinase-like protein
MGLLRKGAEAELYQESWYGLNIIRKIRTVKAYRHPQLDLTIRQVRTGREAQIMREAKGSGVPTPLIYLVDLDSTTIIMQYIEGPRVKDLLPTLSFDERLHLCFHIGQLIGRLHKARIIHGDLTTSNMILSESGKLFFIDFGLSEHSEELEKRGVDVLLLKRAFYSTHYSFASECFKAVIEGYTKEMGEETSKNVVERAEKVAKRGRYILKR